jgi:hypothetical protein
MENNPLERDLSKLTGPVEHWLTTYHTGYWGFREKHEGKWYDMEVGEVVLLHGAGPQNIGGVRDAGGGVIGVGVVGGFSEKDEPVWLEELQGGDRYPYLIHFEELYWFGDADEVEDKPVDEKNRGQIRTESKAISENCISFKEMDERAGYRIPAQGSYSNLREGEKLLPLLRERLRGESPQRPESLEDRRKEDEGEEDESGTTSRRERNRDRGDVDSGTRKVEREYDLSDTIEKNLRHEEILDIFEDRLREGGFNTGETSGSHEADLLSDKDDVVILTEAKTIDGGNQKRQIRKGIGQLLEYHHFNVKENDEVADETVILSLLLSDRPTGDFLRFLRGLQDDEVYTFWIEEGEVDGFDTSMELLESAT